MPNCEVASVACIDDEISRMESEQAALGCDHRAVFDTTYLELTRELRRDLDTDPGLFNDPRYLYAEDALFADVYFDTLHAWESGGPVAPAWRIAFEQAEHGQITGAQEMLLGINAHVQNDMPFVIAALGVRQPDGTSRKHDYDAFNEVLNRAYEPVVTAIRQRFDPSMGLTNPDLVTLDDIGGLGPSAPGASSSGATPSGCSMPRPTSSGRRSRSRSRRTRPSGRRESRPCRSPASGPHATRTARSSWAS